jgi:serine/threonine-protein kinase RsbW
MNSWTRSTRYRTFSGRRRRAERQDGVSHLDSGLGPDSGTRPDQGRRYVNQDASESSGTAVDPSDIDAVELRIPASSAYLALVRATTNSTCARGDFTLDRLDDVTLAVDEAVSLLMSDSKPGTSLTCRWLLSDSGITITVASSSSAGRAPRTRSFAWTVLTALVDHAHASIVDDIVTITLTAKRDWPRSDSVS